MHSAAGESALVAGWLASDMGDATMARNFYNTAERAAKETSYPIAACAFGYRSCIPSTKGANGRARALLTGALEALPNDSLSPGTLSWLAARYAEESAALGDKQQALVSWGKPKKRTALLTETRTAYGHGSWTVIGSTLTALRHTRK